MSINDMTLAEAALFYAEQCGLEVFPQVPGGKIPACEHG